MFQLKMLQRLLAVKAFHLLLETLLNYTREKTVSAWLLSPVPRKDLVHSWFLESICWIKKSNSCWLWNLITYLTAPPLTMLLLPSPSPGVCSNSCPWVGDAIETFHPLSPSFPFAFNLYSIRVFPSESALPIRWPKYWSFSFSISSSNEYWGWISFRIDWFDLLAVQGTPKSLLQHHNSKASILWHSAFSVVHLSYPYMTTGKTIDLTRWTFVCKVMSLLLNTLSRFVIDFLQRSKRLLISWLQPPSTVILEPKKRKSVTVSTCSPFICHEVMGQDAMILVFWMLF